MAALASRLRNKIAGAFASDDTRQGRAVATGWLRLMGAHFDYTTGTSSQTDWLKMRAAASGIHEDQPDQLTEPE